MTRSLQKLPAPAILVSFVFLEKFLERRKHYCYRDWVMDSGAYSAQNSGTKIDLQQYIETCRRMLCTDHKLTEVFALDVIGNWQASLKNTEKMWEAGVPAIPCFHYGEPWDALSHIAKTYPKIAIGGVAMVDDKTKTAWSKQCFARVWPKRIHGFGVGSRKQILSMPFHSVDATNWQQGPLRFGNWHTFGKLSVRGGSTNVRVEVERFLELEKEAKWRWRKEMSILDAIGKEQPI